MWAFGVLLWEIETGGAAPFKGLKMSVMKHVRQGGRLIAPASASPILGRAMQRAWEPAESRPPMKDFLNVLLGPSKEKRELLARVSEWGPEEAAAWLDCHDVPREHELHRIAAAGGGGGLERRLLEDTGSESPLKDSGDDGNDGNDGISRIPAAAVTILNPMVMAVTAAAEESKTSDANSGQAPAPRRAAAVNLGNLRREMLGLRALEEWAANNC